MGKESVSAARSQIRMARVLHEDDKFVTLEVCKHDDTPLRVEDGDKYWSLIFVHADENSRPKVWLPWENE